MLAAVANRHPAPLRPDLRMPSNSTIAHPPTHDPLVLSILFVARRGQLFIALQGRKPGECPLSRKKMLLRHCGKPPRDNFGINEPRVKQRRYEVLILLPKRAELGDAKVFLVEAPTRVLRPTGRRGRVRVLDPDQTITPAIR
jgi:hypothetical protein